MRIIILLTVVYGLLFSSSLFATGIDANAIKRAEISKLILLAKNHDVNYLPPAAVGGQYTDVLQNSFNASWIEQLKADGITEGCAANKYCPNEVVTRVQLAKLLLKAKHGAGFIPMLAEGVFADVPANAFSADWIEALKTEGITEGCGNNKFCPNDVVSVTDFYTMLSRALGDIVTVYEDAENGDIAGWNLYATTAGSTINNVFDADKGNRVIELQGNNGLDNGFYLTPQSIDSGDGFIISWAMKYAEDFKFFIKVSTDNPNHDVLYIYYTPEDVSRGYEEIGGYKYIHIGLGSYAKDNRWIRFTRDVEADLKAVFPNESIVDITTFSIRGSGRIDDIQSSVTGNVTELIHRDDDILITANGSPMRVSIYYQQANVQRPTIYFAAGGASDHINYEHLIHHLVNQGYVVVAASYDGGFNATHISDNFFEAFVHGWNMATAKGINDDTRTGLIGHSSGAGTLPSLAYKFYVEQGMGSNGRFVFGATPWVDFQYEKKMVLPNDTNFVTQWYEDDHGTDPRIYLDMYRHLALNNKTFITLKQNTTHSTISAGTPLDVVERGIYAPLDALARYTFKGIDKSSIFPDTDVDNADLHILANGTLPSAADYQTMFDAFVNDGSAYPCDSAAGGVYPANPRKSECEAYATGREFPVDAQFEGEDVATQLMALPDYLETYQDPVFDSTVTKISDRVTHTPTVSNAHPYPKQGSAWNSDGSIIRLQYRLYDAVTFQELAVTAGKTNGQAYSRMGSPYHGGGDLRWSTTDPNVMYTLDSNQKYKKVTINAARTTTTFNTLIDLSGRGYTNLSTGNNEGNLDHNDQYIIFAGEKAADDHVYAMLYKLGQADVEWTKILPRGLWKADNNDPVYFDWITVGPKAENILVSAEHKIYLYDMTLGNEFELANTAAHGDVGIDVNGDPVFLQFKFSGEQGIWSYNLNTHAALKLLPSKYNGGHISCRNVQRLGWCYVNTSQEGHKEVFALKLDNATGTTERFAQTHVSLQNRGCSQINVSPDGKKVLFASDWNEGSAADYQSDLATWKSCTAVDRKIKIDTYQAEITW